MKWITTTALLILIAVNSIQISGQWQKNVIDDEGISGAVSVDTADLNGDDLLDLVLVSYRNNSLYWYENQFPDWIRHTIDDSAPHITFAYCSDVDGNDTMDIIANLYSAGQLVWYENKHPQWIKHIIDPNTVGPDFIQLVDMNGDEVLDVVCATSSELGGDVVWYECQYPLWVRHVIESAEGKYPCSEVADLDQDGLLDVIVADVEENRISWFKHPEEGEVWSKFHIAENYENVFVLNMGDVNNDGAIDIMATSGGPYFEGSTVAWYENRFPEWERHVIDTSLDGAVWPELMDVNDDGMMDMVVDGYQGNALVWYRNEDTAWTRFPIDTDLHGPRLFQVIDLDSDDQDDIVVAAEQKLIWYRNPGDMAYPLNFEVYPDQSPDQDTLFFYAELYNPEDHMLSMQVYLSGLETTYQDSLELFDDGAHHDGNPGDHHWANMILYSSLPEGIYEAKVVAFDSATGSSNDYLPSQQFGNVGPIRFESLVVDNADTTFRPGSAMRIWIEIKNKGSEIKLENIKAKLSSDDPYTEVVKAIRYFDDIPAGESAISSSTFVFRLSEDCPVDRMIPFHLEITSDDQFSWTDDFNIYVSQSTVSVPGTGIASLSIYPNPVHEFIRIKTEALDLHTVSIISPGGLNLYQQEHQGPAYQIDLSSFEPGVYFITVRSEDFVATKKIVKLQY